MYVCMYTYYAYMYVCMYVYIHTMHSYKQIETLVGQRNCKRRATWRELSRTGSKILKSRPVSDLPHTMHVL